MISNRDTQETAAAKELSHELRVRLAEHLEARAEKIELASTARHVELIKYDEVELLVVRSVAHNHRAIIQHIAQEIKDPASTIDDYRNFGNSFAATAVDRGILLRDAIDGLLFLKSEILRDLAEEGFLLEMTGMEVKGLVDFIGTRIDVLFAELAVSFHKNFTGQLQEQLEFREKQNRQKDLFIRIASHEIRNPLSIALSLCEIIGVTADESNKASAAPMYVEIQSNLLSINRHLSQLLDMSLLENDQLTLKKEKISLLEFLQGIIHSFERLHKNRLVTLVCSETIDVISDPDKVEQIVTNLMQNANKYSPPGGPIEISVLQEESHISIEVTDYGNGIKKEDTERIFDPYLRLAKDKEKVEGLGLGLYICRTLSQGLGGTLTVQSTPGSGSTFTLTLPRHS